MEQAVERKEVRNAVYLAGVLKTDLLMFNTTFNIKNDS